MSPSECFDATERALLLAEGDLAKAAAAGATSHGGYVDGGELQRQSEEIEENVSALRFGEHWKRVATQHQRMPAEVADSYAQGSRVAKLLAQLRQQIQQQVDDHQILMRSAHEVMPEGKKYSALRSYVVQRLRRAKSADIRKRTSSVENVKELLRVIRQHRAGRMVGLSSRELLFFFVGSFAPGLIFAVLRYVLQHFNIAHLHGGLAMDLSQAFLAPFMAAWWVCSSAGWRHLVLHNLVAVFLLACLFGAAHFTLWFMLLNSRRKKVSRGDRILREREREREQERARRDSGDSGGAAPATGGS